jgi:hypothetical protein
MFAGQVRDEVSPNLPMSTASARLLVLVQRDVAPLVEGVAFGEIGS